MPEQAASVRRFERPAWLRRAGVYWGGHLHEPIYFYRLERRKLAGVDGSAEWLERWYDRCRSDAMLDELAGLGVNCLYLNFFKGFGLQYEAEEMKRSGRLIEGCRRRGIRTVLYVQSSNFFTETLAAEQPEADRWIARDGGGQVLHYGGARHRPLACLQQPGWLSYVVRAAVAAARAGADAILLDNLNHNECCCGMSAAAYRELSGDGSADLAAEAGSRRAINFRVATTMRLVETVVEAVRKINDQCAVMTNPGWPRDRDVLAWGIDVGRLARATDGLLIENRCFPRAEGERIVGSSYAYRLADAAGGLAIPSVWMPGMQLPETAEQARRALCEPLAFGGHVVCAPWALRPLGDHAKGRLGPDEPYLRRDELAEACAACIGLGRSVQSLYADARPWARIAVLHSLEPFVHDYTAALAKMLTIDAALMAEHIPYRLVLPGQPLHREEFDAVIVADLQHLSSADRGVLEGFCAAGGRLVELPAGLTGRLYPDPSVALGPETCRWAASLRERLSTATPYAIQAPRGVVSFVMRRAGRILLGLFNYAGGSVRTGVSVDRRIWPVRQIRLHRLGERPGNLSVSIDGHRARFELPAWDVYALCEMQTA